MLTFKRFIKEDQRDYTHPIDIPKSSSASDKWIDKKWNERVPHNKKYLATGKTDYVEKDEDIPVDKVRVRIQTHVDKGKLNRKIAKLKKGGQFANPISAFHHKGEYHIDDGHHRVMAARAVGHKTIRAHVHYLDQTKES